MTHPLRTRSATLATACVLALPLVACSQDEPAPRSEPTPTSPAPTVNGGEQLHPLGKVLVGEVAGHLPRGDARRALGSISAVVDRWLADAYLAGPYPRQNFEKSWRVFTPGAAREAKQDRRLLSNAGAQITQVRPLRRRIAVDLLAVRRRVVGATARVRVGFDATGSRAHRTVTVRGRLFLTRTPAGWRVFGYDVSRGSM